jgi:hypothetical protein
MQWCLIIDLKILDQEGAFLRVCLEFKELRALWTEFINGWIFGGEVSPRRSGIDFPPQKSVDESYGCMLDNIGQ